MCPDKIFQKESIACKSARAIVDGDASLRYNFMLLAIKQGASREVASSVYDNVMTKLCNCRFGAQMKNYAKKKGRGAGGSSVFAKSSWL